MIKKDLDLANKLNDLAEINFKKYDQIDQRENNHYSIDHGEFQNWEIEKKLCKAHLNGYSDGIRDIILFLSFDNRSHSNENYNYNNFGKFLRSKGWEI